MEKFKVSFEASNQQLKALGTKHASDTYADIEATFVLGEKWTDMDSVSAVWWNDFTRVATVLDSQGKCIVPHEVLARKGCVRVNLVGSIVEGDELITRLTSYSAEAVQVNEKIKLTGSETSEITPSQYEQFVANVKADADRAEAGATASANSADEAEASAQNASESASASAVSASDSARSATASSEYAQNASESAQSAENAKDDAEDARDKILGMRATAETLEAGSDATASYSDGLLTLGIPRGDQGIQGIQGETGATPNLTIGTVETLAPTEDATATITGTAENPVLNLGIPKGEQGDVNLSQLEALLPTDTASGSIVTITDGQSVVPVKSLKVTLEPIQDLHGYDKPWAGGAGKNLLNPEYRSYSATVNVRYYRIGGGGLALKAGKTYTLSVDENNTRPNGIYINNYDPSSAPNKSLAYKYNQYSVTYTPAEDVVVETDCYYANTPPEGIENIKVQLEEGTTATSWTPYSNICPISGQAEVNTIVSPTTSAQDGTTYTTALGRTVYGGTLDVVSGELVVDRAMVDLSTLNFNYDSSGQRWQRTMPDIYNYPSRNGNLVAEKYVADTSASAGSEGKMFTVGKGLYIYSTDGTTPLSGNLVYPLATPQTYQLTPQEVQLLLGTNNIWSDGEVTLTYNADIQRYIEKKLQS